MQKQEWTYVDEYEKVIPGWVKYKEYWYYIDPENACSQVGFFMEENGIFSATDQKA